jgi:glycosyltransferase involved in cell wall biosynthesis
VHIAFVHDGPELLSLHDTRVILHKIAAAGNHDVRILYRLYSLVRRIRPEIVQTWLPQMDVLAGLVCIAARIPWVLCERCSPDAYKARLTDRFLRPRVGRRADAVIANSSGGRDVWFGMLPPDASLHVIRNALPLDELRRSLPTKFSELDLAADTQAVIFVGRLDPQKNISVLLRVAEQVVRRSNAVVLICGDGPLRPTIEANVRQVGLKNRIRILGYRSDVAGLLKIAKVFVNPSLYEGQPNSVLEAMACGCALVVSDIPAHREFLNDSLAALVPVTDAEEMTAQIIAALSGSPLSRSRAKASFELAVQWTPDSVVAEYQQVYQQAIKRRRHPAAKLPSQIDRK